MTELNLDVTWYAGAPARTGGAAAPIQIHWAGPNTVILRQNMAVNFEAPFLYLLFGDHTAFLLDTGATEDAARFPLRATVDALIDEWLQRHPHEAYELIVAHSHAHGDHVAGDGQFADRPFTRIVGHTAGDVAGFFALAGWPDGVAEVDLGGRVLEVIPTPGHHPSAITVYDAVTGTLLTGDTVYPGRLYVSDFTAFEASLRTLCDFAASHRVKAVLGAHIEMSTTPRRDFPLGSASHPAEAPLPLTVRDLQSIRDAAAGVANRPGAHRFDNFIIWNGPCRREAAVHFARLLLGRVSSWRRPS